MRKLLAVLAALLLVAPASAQHAPRIDVPPVFTIIYPPGTDVTIEVFWEEESNATDRWLTSSRRGLLAYYGPELQVPYFLDFFDLDDWRPGDTLTLCRRWVDDAVVSCHERVPWPRHSVFIPGLAVP